METVDTSTKIKCLVEMALKGEMTWPNLDSLIDGLTLNLENSRQINRILLKEFENHQSICSIKNSEDSSFTYKATIQQSNSEVELLEISDENQLDELTNINDEDNLSIMNENAQFENDIIDERNIQLVEEFKGQFYTFVGDNSEEQSVANNYNQSLNQKKQSDKSKDLKIPENLKNNITCKYCKKSFKNKSIFAIHERVHSGEKPFKCKSCNKTFTQSSSLVMHERIHTGERPFQCITCKMVFAYSSALKVHTRTHTGEKPYICKYCNKGFTQLAHLKKHERIHTGEKLYKCKKCETCFTQKRSLNTHEKTHK